MTELCDKYFKTDQQNRKDMYRRKGWWTGESLPDRYASIMRGRENDLAVIDNHGGKLTHSDLWTFSSTLSGELDSRKFRKGEIIIILLPNTVEWQVVLLGVLRAGSIPANLPTRTDAENLRYVAELTGARAIVTTEQHGSIQTGDIARSAVQLCTHQIDLLILDNEELNWEPGRIKQLAPPSNVVGLDHIMFTSSTTGRPKAVMHSADTLAALNLTFTERFSLGPHDPIFMASPLGHSVGTIHGARLSLYNAAPLVLQDTWNPEQALEMIAENHCVFTAAATPFLNDLVESDWQRDEPKLASLRWFLCGGTQVPQTLLKKAQQQFPHTFITVLWGMTEGGLTTSIQDSPLEKLLTTAGVGLPGLEMKILDSENRQLPSGKEGELVMRGPGVFIGYYGQDDLYKSLLTEKGFFRTGDFATLSEDGYLQITGRLKDLIIRGGVNIAPVPIEEALASHPKVSGVAVIGYPDERMGELLCAVIIPRGEVPTLEVLNCFLQKRGLPKYHCPEMIRIVEKFPTTPAGKIRKATLREEIIKETEMEKVGA